MAQYVELITESGEKFTIGISDYFELFQRTIESKTFHEKDGREYQLNVKQLDGSLIDISVNQEKVKLILTFL